MFFLLRPLFALLSLAILAAGGFLLWEWFDGEWVQEADGVLRRVRADWMLWAGGALLAWSFLGRFLVVPLLAKADRDPTKPERGNGDYVQGAYGRELYVETHGATDAPPIILTHGWSLDSTIWHYAKCDLASE